MIGSKQNLSFVINSFFFDVDGTLLINERPIGDSVMNFNRLSSRPDTRTYILSNNTSRSVTSTAHKLQRLGFDIDESNLITPQVVFLEYLENHSINEVHLVGNRQLTDDLKKNMASLNPESTKPEAVVVAFDTELTYDKLSVAGEYLTKGIPLWALIWINSVLRKMDEFECGSIVALLETAYSVTSSKIR